MVTCNNFNNHEFSAWLPAANDKQWITNCTIVTNAN